MINPNWPRWIYHSLINHFRDYKKEIPFYIEGQTRDSAIANFAEYRQDGPFFNEINFENYYIDVLPAILIQTTQDNDTLKLDRYVGTFLEAFTKGICVYRLGTGPEDDGEMLGSLRLSTKSGERIRVDKFGQTIAATRVAQATIEANYRMILKT